MNTVHPGNKKKGTGTVLTYIFTRDQGKIISTTEKVSKPRDTSLFGFGYSSKTNKPTLQGSAVVFWGGPSSLWHQPHHSLK